MFNVYLMKGKRIMKKQYIQPSIEVNAMNAAQNLMSASNPWNQNGIIKDDQGEDIVPQF